MATDHLATELQTDFVHSVTAMQTHGFETMPGDLHAYWGTDTFRPPSTLWRCHDLLSLLGDRYFSSPLIAFAMSWIFETLHRTPPVISPYAGTAKYPPYLKPSNQQKTKTFGQNASH